MLGILLLYIVAMIFAVKKDREEIEGPTLSVSEANQKVDNQKGNNLSIFFFFLSLP